MDKFTRYCLIFILVGCAILAIMDGDSFDSKSFMFGFTSAMMAGSTMRNTGIIK